MGPAGFFMASIRPARGGKTRGPWASGCGQGPGARRAGIIRGFVRIQKGPSVTDAVPISQADYDLPLETLEAHLLAQMCIRDSNDRAMPRLVLNLIR